MAQNKLDFLSRRSVKVVTFISLDTSELSVASRLPEGYFLENGKFIFPAGHWESYFVNGKEYNTEGNRRLDEQIELIKKDLLEEGLSLREAEEFIQEIEVKEGRPMLLTPEASNKWLGYHPEFEQTAFRLLHEIQSETSNESKRSRFGREMKKR